MSRSHLTDNLALVAAETRRLVATAAGLDDDAVRAPSLCGGWSRAHVLTHVARNADALTNLATWATTGVPTPMYASPEARDADIERGARRDARELLADLESSAARFAEAAAGLAGPAGDVEVEMRGGVLVRAASLPTLRLREVVFHHVDVGAGYTFAETDPGFVERSLANAVERMDRATPPPLELRAQEGGVWTVGAATPAAQVVTGSRAELLLWLARGIGDGLRSDAPLPALPSWG